MKAATDSRTPHTVVWNDNWPLGCHARIICVTTNTGGRTYHSCRITIVSVPPHYHYSTAYQLYVHTISFQEL